MDFLQKNIDISHLSNFKTEAKAKYFFEIKSEDDVLRLREIMEFRKSFPVLSNFSLQEVCKLPILFIGGGTNLLFAFDVFEGIVIKNSLNGFQYDEKNKILEIYSNEPISDIAKTLEKDFKNDLWHRFIGLPGTIGGAVFGNAGCFGLETENNFVEATVYNLKTGQIEVLGKKDCDFSYRSSIFKKTGDYFIVKARFDVSKKVEKYHSEVDNIYFREHKQPKGNTCGSFFKNPKINRDNFFTNFPNLCEDCVKNISAGFLLEQVGMKGFRHKTAYFSKLHSNFLMSEGNGNHKDLLDLIEIAQKKVKEKFGIDLEAEVRIVTTNNR